MKNIFLLLMFLSASLLSAETAHKTLEQEFLKAINELDITKVKHAVDKGLDINALKTNKYPVLMQILNDIPQFESEDKLIENQPKRQQIINYLIDQGADVNATVDDARILNYPPLFFAVANDMHKVVASLLKHKADTSKKKSHPASALFSVQSIKMLGFLLDSKLYNLNERSEKGKTLLHQVLKTSTNIELIKYLTNKISLELKDDDGYTALLTLVFYDDEMDTRKKVFIHLLKKGADVKALSKNKQSVLFLAIHSKFPFEIIDRLINAGVDINACDIYGICLSHTAAVHPDIRVIKRLHKAGVDLNSISKNNLTPLLLGFRNDNPEVMKYMIKQKIDLNVKNGYGETALNLAIKYKKYDIQIALEKAGALASSAKEIDNVKKQRAQKAQKKKADKLLVIDSLKDAIRLKNLAEVKRYFAKEKKPNLYKLASYSCKKGNLETFRFLVEKGLDLKMKDKDGFTLLHDAVFYNNMGITKYLIKNKADINATSPSQRSVFMMTSNASKEMYEYLVSLNIKISSEDKKTLLENAINYKKISLAKYLMTKGYKFDKAYFNKHQTIAEFAQDGEIEAIAFLLDQGMDIDKRFKLDSEETTLANYAYHAIPKKIALVKYLLERGTNVHARARNISFINDEGMYVTLSGANSILYEGLILFENIALLEIILKNGFDVNHKPKEAKRRDAPLILALSKEKPNSAKFLLENGADVNAVSAVMGYSSLYFATKYGYLDLVKLLIKKGANPFELSRNKETLLDIAKKNKHESLVEYLSSLKIE